MVPSGHFRGQIDREDGCKWAAFKPLILTKAAVYLSSEAKARPG